MRAATAGFGVVALMLLAGCRHDAGAGIASRHDERSTADASDRSDADAGSFSACGARFDIPAEWVPEERSPGQWAVNGHRSRGDGLTVSVRCLPDHVVSPREQFTEIDVVRDAFGYGPDTLHKGTLEYRSWIDTLPDRPAVIALLQSDEDGPGRVEVAIWADPDKRWPDDPPSRSQGLIAIRWSDDDPHQVAQYTALRTQITSSFSAPLPENGYDRTRIP